jgi:hypothetical protein
LLFHIAPGTLDFIVPFNRESEHLEQGLDFFSFLYFFVARRIPHNMWFHDDDILLDILILGTRFLDGVVEYYLSQLRVLEFVLKCSLWLEKDS